jgi:hypothetical protein
MMKSTFSPVAFTVRPTHLAFPQEQQNPPNARRSRQADGNGHGTLDDG